MALTHHTGIPRMTWIGEYPPCVPYVTIGVDVNPFCPGDSVTFTPSYHCIDGIEISTYVWSVNNVLVSSSGEAFTSDELSDGDKVFLAFSDSNGNTYFSNIITVSEKSEGCVTDGLELTFDDIANVPVADASSVSDWNAFFDLPTNGSPFTSVTVDGDKVKLYGGDGITLKDELFYFGVGSASEHLLKFVDIAECVIEAGSSCFEWNAMLNEVSLPVCTSAGDNCFHGIYGVDCSFNLPLLESAGVLCFAECNNVTELNLPLLTSVGNACFQFVGADSGGCTFTLTSLNGNTKFRDCVNPVIIMPNAVNIGGTVGNDDAFGADMYNTQSVQLTIPSAIMTCNGGNPDGDIQWIQDPENGVTVTIITV